MPSSITSSEVTTIKVLVVDDNEAVLARVSALLGPHCATVECAPDGRTGLAVAATLRPDVIVLDISMPGLSGLDVARALRRAGSTAPIVFLTVHEDAAIVEAGQAAGAIGYVVKSRLGSDLLRAVRDARAGLPFVSVIR
jgi:DNA-binding NarL/FixJ family response regulator